MVSWDDLKKGKKAFEWLRNLVSQFRATEHNEKAKKVLVLEGGGMRGIFTTGVLQAFSDRGYFPWELIIGTSAGAITGIGYAARQIHLVRDAYFTELLKGQFINVSNILRPEKHILNLDWLIDNIIKGKDPLDLRALQRCCRVLITATNCIPGHPPETIYLDSRKDDVPTALKATAAIPFLYRGFVEYEDYRFLDGALLDPIPYRKALDLGYQENEILVVVTRKKGYRKHEESFWIKSLYENYYKDPQFKYLVEAMKTRYMEYNRIIDDLENTYSGIDVIYAPKAFSVDRLTKDDKKILAGFNQGVAAGRDYLEALKKQSE